MLALDGYPFQDIRYSVTPLTLLLAMILSAVYTSSSMAMAILRWKIDEICLQINRLFYFEPAVGVRYARVRPFSFSAPPPCVPPPLCPPPSLPRTNTIIRFRSTAWSKLSTRKRFFHAGFYIFNSSKWRAMKDLST